LGVLLLPGVDQRPKHDVGCDGGTYSHPSEWGRPLYHEPLDDAVPFVGGSVADDYGIAHQNLGDRAAEIRRWITGHDLGWITGHDLGRLEVFDLALDSASGAELTYVGRTGHHHYGAIVAERVQAFASFHVCGCANAEIAPDHLGAWDFYNACFYNKIQKFISKKSAWSFHGMPS
jgi:hypothetical protein